MAKSMDPLSLLRDYNVNKKNIIERDSQIIFGELSCHRYAVTNYQKHPGPKKKLPKNFVKEYYTIETLLFFLKNVHIFHPEYCKLAAEANIPAVRRPDRKQLLSYLNGETATSDAIDKTVKLEIPKREANIPAVRRPDRKQLLSYLKGKTATSDAIDKTVKWEFQRGYVGGGTENTLQVQIQQAAADAAKAWAEGRALPIDA